MIHERLFRHTALIALTLTGGVMLAAAEDAGLQAVPFDSPRWQIEGPDSIVKTHLGRPSLELRGGSATLPDVLFSDGIIEFDIAFGEERNFGGVRWRMQDDASYEHFYLRPHQSGRADSMQYTPVFHGVAGWQLYHGEGYGANVRYTFGEWIHVRIVVSGQRAEISVGSDQPVLAVRELKRGPAPGPLGLMAGNLAPFHFSNFAYQVVDRPPLSVEVPPMPALPEGTVCAWAVSEPFDGTTLQSVDASVDAAAHESWSTLASEERGITNLARLYGRSEGRDTVFARLTIHSDSARTKEVQFGYSDRVRVYLNGRLLYSGDNSYVSRDFRYLGTIGLFDTVVLSLNAGENELLFAVSEQFGGWGIQARFPDDAGIRWEP